VAASASAATPKVELRNVNLRYFGLEGETEALNDVSISIAPGEFVAIIGQSGCGKSTLLSLISGILMPTGGTVLLDGKLVTGPSRKVGYMLQQDYLFEWRTILENAVLGAEIQGADMTKARERAAALLTRYGLGQFLQHRPRQLSGGMRQRVNLARALAIDPQILLMDEPFSALDALTRGTLQDEVRRICVETGQTAFMITHDVDEAIYLADRVVLMTNGPNALLAEIVENPLPKDRQRSDVHRHPLYYGVRNHIIDFLVSRSKNFADEIQGTNYDRRQVPVVRPGAPEPVVAAESAAAVPSWSGLVQHRA
jgi:nitrate/nitrite transport system ATP-binding protein